MKKSALHFLGRKSQSLFDTSIKIKDMDNAELVLESPAIPESGTASVRARPTVKHHNSPSFDTFQGYAVPIPKVPLLPPLNGSKINGSVGEDSLSNGSVISVPDLEDGEIFIPAPPSMAPPPPPGTFFPPPPDFMGDLNSLQHPSMPAPTPTFLPPSPGGEDFSLLKPPPLAPPNPPPTSLNGSTSPLPMSPTNVPHRPTFAPPEPPSERQSKAYKTPPPKPMRLSSISIPDSPPHSPAPPPPAQMPTQSTFNPQNTAKIYNIPKTSILGSYEDRDTRPKQMLVLEDSGSVKSTPVLVQTDWKAPKTATLPRPDSKDAPKLSQTLNITHSPPSPLPDLSKEVKTATVPPPEIDKSPRALPQTPPQLQKVNSTSELFKNKPEGSPSQGCKFSPLLDRKLRNLKSDTSGSREGPAASPLALLMAAKERDKHRLSQSASHETSTKKHEQASATIQPSDSNRNSFIVTPRSSSFSSSLKSQDILEGGKSVSSVQHTQRSQTLQKSSTTAQVKDKTPFPSLALNRTAASTSATNLDTMREKSKPQSTQHEDNSVDLNLPLLPPPPEFGDFDDVMGPPPSIPPPDPPMKITQTQAQAPSPPAPKPPAIPKPPPPPPIYDKPTPQVQTKPKMAPAQLPATLSPNQTTLLSILQKKMLEMDHKMSPMKEAESTSDDWGTPLSDEDNKVTVFPKASPQSKSYPVANKAANLDMQELESKVVKKYQETSSTKVPTSNGKPSKQYGMTFTVRPGTRQPITLVSKGDL